jgi:hypothetical protein
MVSFDKKIILSPVDVGHGFLLPYFFCSILYIHTYGDLGCIDHNLIRIRLDIVSKYERIRLEHYFPRMNALG